MRSLSLYINTLFWGKSVVILIQNILDIIFFLASRKSKYQRAICCWGGSLGHTGNSSIHLESTCRGSRGELLALPHSVLLQMCKTSSGKLSNGSQDLPTLRQLLQGSARLCWVEAPVTLLMLQVPPAHTASGRGLQRLCLA